MKLHINSIRNAKLAPGYESNITAASERKGKFLIIADEDYMRIWVKWASTAPRETPVKLTAIPRDQWPERVEKIAGLANPGEPGIGSVVNRLLKDRKDVGDAVAVIAGEFGKVATMIAAFKWLTGRECGCGDRVKRLDLLYPLP